MSLLLIAGEQRGQHHPPWGGPFMDILPITSYFRCLGAGPIKGTLGLWHVHSVDSASLCVCCVCKWVYVSTAVYVCIAVYVCSCVYMYVYMCGAVCVCACIQSERKDVQFSPSPHQIYEISPLPLIPLPRVRPTCHPTPLVLMCPYHTQSEQLPSKQTFFKKL